MALLRVCFGLRISEALALKWQDIDWLNGRLRVERGIICQNRARGAGHAETLQASVSPGTRLNVQHFVLGVLKEESSVGPKALGNGNDTEYGSLRFRVLGTPNLGDTDFRQFPNRTLVVLFQPRRQFGIVALPATSSMIATIA